MYFYIGDRFCHLQLPTGSSMGSEVGPFRTETGADCRDGEVRLKIILHYAHMAYRVGSGPGP